MPAWAGARGRAVVLAVVLLVGVAIVADATAATGAGAGAGAVESATPHAPGELLLSTDGVTFSSSLSGPVLQRVGEVVPGESVSAPFWVRNPTDRRVHWRAEVRELAVTSAAYAEAVTLSIWHVGAGQSHTVTLDALSPCDALASSSLAPGATAKMLLTFGMDLGADNGTQGQAAALRIQVTMRDSAGGPLAAPAGEDGAVDTASDPGRPAALAYTGAAPPAAALALGALAAGVGLALLGRRRRGIGGEQ